ncbi:hypothetical protein EB809_04445 [Marinobacter sp. R17]|uniref:hypothetical protein n=1 Tax=Marinobacter sp. R17 TaxID=2484250 RepID=UPI000F4B9630|nr:hypothetical protein [Marinobacter sp. R17]ROU01355.1 hypothetical protein EB809_04445 [Marinobacter sp. R17]
MLKDKKWSSETDDALSARLGQFQEEALRAFEGREAEAVIAITRVLDFTTVSALWRYSGQANPARAQKVNPMVLLKGCAPALRPFLAATKFQGGGLPFGPSDPVQTDFAYSYLNACGSLTFLRRMAALERFGLASTEKITSDHYRITVSAGVPEEASRYLRSMLAEERKTFLSTRKRKYWNKLHARMKKYVQPSDDWFIRYDNDWPIVEAYRENARLFSRSFPEGEAFPDETPIGDRTFGDWKEACNQALGRILTHIDFAMFLHNKKPSIALDNVLTIFIRRDDAEAVWEEAGLPPSQIRATMRALTLEHEDLDGWEQAFEVPTVFYIGIGKNFLLLPCFGALLNSYFALFRHLRDRYRVDWDRAVDNREAVFRASLGELFSHSRYLVPDHGFKLRRESGSVITDIDAVIVDRETGDLALVQLKWHDVFGFSLKERESRRKNIEKANEWVKRVVSWIDGRSSQEVAAGLGIEGTLSRRPPVLYVIARYEARFSGDHVYDDRACWLGWPEMQAVYTHLLSGADSPLLEIPVRVKEGESYFHEPEFLSRDFKFPNLTVTLDYPSYPSDSGE